MKVITKEEWNNAPEENKKIYYGTQYMVYKEEDGGICFGPVKVVNEDIFIDYRRLINKTKEDWGII